ncbi:hypothetical protein PO124_04790 [Bacillus licheniformis]|nr:hypothetical protein [Bacillus licheniformis]
MEWEYHKDYAPVRRRAAYARHILLGRRSAKEVRLLAWGLSFLIYINLLLKAYILCCGIFRSEARAGRFNGFLIGGGNGFGVLLDSVPIPFKQFSVGIYRCTWGRVPIINGTPGYRQRRCRYVGYMENGKRLFLL